MALPTVIAKNQTGTPILLPRLGVTLPVFPGALNLTSDASFFEVASEPVLEAKVAVGDVVINDGASDLSLADALVYIDATGNLNGPSGTPVDDSLLKLDGITGRYTEITGVTVDASDNITTTGSIDVGGVNIGGSPLAISDLNDVDTTGAAHGDVLYFDGTNWVELAAGVAGTILTTNGAGAAPSWSTAGEAVPRFFSYSLTSSSGAPYVEVTSVAYTIIGMFDWPGSDTVQPVSLLSSIVQLGGGISMSVRVWDVTNSAIIAELTGIVTPTFAHVNLGTLTNISTTPAVWEIQTLGVGGGRKARVAAFAGEFT